MADSVQPATGEAPRCHRHPDRETWIRCQRCDRPICPDCMVSAAVGFQCPDCVRAGVKSVRSARLPYGGAPSADPRLTTFVIIGLNVAVWVAITLDGGLRSGLLGRLALIPQLAGLTRTDGTREIVDGVANGAWWQVLTSGFTHQSMIHLGVNMLALYFLGPVVESVLGRTRFLAVYFLALLSGSAGVMLFSNQFQMTVGASGALYGIFGALLLISMRVGGDTRSILTWLGLNLLITFSVPMISWQGHLGGLTGGLLATGLIIWAPRARRGLLQLTGMAALFALAIAVILWRAQDLGQLVILGVS